MIMILTLHLEYTGVLRKLLLVNSSNLCTKPEQWFVFSCSFLFLMGNLIWFCVKGMVTACWSLGLVVGSIIGGLLANPCELYPHLFSESSIFATFPYLLPNLGTIILSLVMKANI